MFISENVCTFGTLPCKHQALGVWMSKVHVALCCYCTMQPIHEFSYRAMIFSKMFSVDPKPYLSESTMFLATSQSIGKTPLYAFSNDSMLFDLCGTGWCFHNQLPFRAGVHRFNKRCIDREHMMYTLCTQF